MAAERGFEVDHTTIYRWVIKFTPELEKGVPMSVSLLLGLMLARLAIRLASRLMRLR